MFSQRVFNKVSLSYDRKEIKVSDKELSEIKLERDDFLEENGIILFICKCIGYF